MLVQITLNVSPPLGNKSMRLIEGLGQALSELPMLVKTASKLGLT